MVDWLKAIAILAVVWIHAVTVSISAPPESRTVFVFLHLSQFAVPAFFFVAGFMAWQETPRSAGFAWERLRRLLVPYLIASGLMEWRRFVMQPVPPTPGDVVLDLLTGNALEIYYFVPMLACMIPVALLLSRAPRWAAPLFVGSLLIEGLCVWYALVGNISWLVRIPAFWLSYYLFGWFARGHWEALCRLKESRRVLLDACAVAPLAAYLAFLLEKPLEVDNPLQGALGSIMVYFTIALLALLFSGARAPDAVRWLGGSTYFLYLYHFPVVAWTRQQLGGGPGWQVSLPAWCAGVGVPLLVYALLQRGLGRDRMRSLFG